MISKDFTALKGSTRITSTTTLVLAKERRFSDPFKDNQHDAESSAESEISPIVEQEGSSTSDDSQESSLDTVLENQNVAEA